MNIGLHDGIVASKHAKAMGMSVWLYMWCLNRQTKPNGLVLGGAPITYEMIGSQTGYAMRTMKRWMAMLTANGYLEVSYLNFKGMRIRVLKAKKFGFRQLPLPVDEPSERVPELALVPEVARAENGPSRVPDVAPTRATSGPSKQSGSKKHIEPNATPLAHGFEEFWKAYPRKAGKPRAEAAFRKVATELAAILAGVAKWKFYWDARGEPEFVPHPTTFLNQRRWEDEPPAAGGSNGAHGSNGANRRDRAAPGALHSEPGKQYPKPRVFGADG